jgi:abortive infection bacteriophage resistance protein
VTCIKDGYFFAPAGLFWKGAGLSQSSPGNRSSYQKPWLPFAEQVQQLISRGLIVADAAAAEAFLAHVNYYRFSGYCLAFEQQRHQFHPGVTFEQVRAAYDFDLALRGLVTEALEIIEVDFRANIAFHFGQKHGAFGHVDPMNFFARFSHLDWLAHVRDEVSRSSEAFVQRFRKAYAEYPDVPVWMLMEVISFGTLARMYRGMVRGDQRTISLRYGLQSGDLATIILHLVYIRNLCAHHSRLWDRVWSIKPQLPRGKAWQPPVVPDNERLFATLLLLFHLLKRCPAIGARPVTWGECLHALFANPPSAPNALNKMGVPVGWDQHPIWK